MENITFKIKGALFGTAVGDALGVPVEFKSRQFLHENPVTDYLGFLCWNQPPGTFSDDSSMAFCTVESLCNGFNINDIAEKFIAWYTDGYWGAHDKLFDIGGTTKHSLDRLIKGESPLNSGGFFPEENGNGSLMRILPITFSLLNTPCIANRYEMIKELSGITHAHFRSVFSCFIYVEFALSLLKFQNKQEAYLEMQKNVLGFIDVNEFNNEEIKLFDRILLRQISKLYEHEISSFGYVLDSLESSIWCFMTTDSYEESVLKSVNLGGDTDTTGAITGGLAGMYYGINAIPHKWLTGIAKKDEIEHLSVKFINALDV